MKHLFLVVFSLIVVGLFTPVTPSWAGVTDSFAPSVVFLTQDLPSGKEGRYGSGFLVNKDNMPFLVTAAHVAHDIGTNFSMVMSGSDGKAIIDRMQKVKWLISQNADVALFAVETNNEDKCKQLLARCIPANLITSRSVAPSRDLPLVVMGYPLRLGTTGLVSPLSLETRAASGLISIKRFDTNKLATFILLQIPSASGLSGGPVFDVGRLPINGGRNTDQENIGVVGLIHGVIWDKTGGKFAMVVPSGDIATLLASSSLKGLQDKPGGVRYKITTSRPVQGVNHGKDS